MTDLKATRDAVAADTSAAPAPILALRLPLTVEVGSVDLTLREIVNLKPASSIAIGSTEAGPVRLYVNGVPVATGDLLSDGDRLTFRVKSVESAVLDAGTLSAGAAGPKGAAS